MSNANNGGIDRDSTQRHGGKGIPQKISTYLARLDRFVSVRVLTIFNILLACYMVYCLHEITEYGVYVQGTVDLERFALHDITNEIKSLRDLIEGLETEIISVRSDIESIRLNQPSRY